MSKLNTILSLDYFKDFDKIELEDLEFLCEQVWMLFENEDLEITESYCLEQAKLIQQLLK